MRLSENILNTDFEEVKMGLVGGKTGYLAKQVDAHLQSAALEAEKLEKTNENLSRQIEMYEHSKKNVSDIQLDKVMSMDEVHAKEVELEEKANEISQMRETFERLILVAQQEASTIKEQARKEAADIYNDAQKNAKLIVEKAREIERDSDEKIKENVEMARNELRAMSDKYEDIKGRLTSVYEAIGTEVSKMGSNERQVG